MIKRLAILDDYQGAAFSQPYWKQLQGRVELEAYRDTLHDEERLVQRLSPYQILVPIRERTHFSERILEQLPALELLSLTGKNSGQVELAAATAQGILVTQTSGSGATAIEMTMALMLALAHRVAQEDRAMRQGLWQTGIGFDLAGKTLGILGLGRIGSIVGPLAGAQLAGGEAQLIATAPQLSYEARAEAGARITWACACSRGAPTSLNKKRPSREPPTRLSTICSGKATSSPCICGSPIAPEKLSPPGTSRL